MMESWGRFRRQSFQCYVVNDCWMQASVQRCELENVRDLDPGPTDPPPPGEADNFAARRANGIGVASDTGRHDHPVTGGNGRAGER